MRGATVKVPATPASDSRTDLWSRCATREAGREFRETLADSLRGERLPAHVTAAATISFSDRRLREGHNYRQVLRRAIEDVLAAHGQPSALVDFTVKLRKGAPRPATTITFEPSERRS